VASFSDGTLYINQLLVTNGAFNNDFSGLLTQVWDFDDQTNPVSNNNLSSVIVQNVPVRTYNDPTADSTQKPDPILIDLPPSSWTNYNNALQGVQKEVPPLPGQDPTIPADTHHQIRDFMFLDAAVNRIFSNSSSFTGPPSDITTLQGITCQIKPIGLSPVTATEDNTAPQVSQGTGPHTTSGKLLVDETTVATNATLNFLQNNVEIALMLYELQDATMGNPASVVPNWFGVAVPNGLTDFSKPILYFHPTPSQNNYIDTTGSGPTDNNYLAKTATAWTGSGRDWRELFAYMDRLGNQLAGAIQQGANANQIVIMPFMTSDSASAAGIAFLKNNWLAIITNILRDISINRSSSASSS
jgi:hypothetical protein